MFAIFSWQTCYSGEIKTYKAKITFNSFGDRCNPKTTYEVINNDLNLNVVGFSPMYWSSLFLYINTDNLESSFKNFNIDWSVLQSRSDRETPYEKRYEVVGIYHHYLSKDDFSNQEDFQFLLPKNYHMNSDFDANGIFVFRSEISHMSVLPFEYLGEDSHPSIYCLHWLIPDVTYTITITSYTESPSDETPEPTSSCTNETYQEVDDGTGFLLRHNQEERVIFRNTEEGNFRYTFKPHWKEYTVNRGIITLYAVQEREHLKQKGTRRKKKIIEWIKEVAGNKKEDVFAKYDLGNGSKIRGSNKFAVDNLDMDFCKSIKITR
jgi:hypothetical protein